MKETVSCAAVLVQKNVRPCYHVVTEKIQPSAELQRYTAVASWCYSSDTSHNEACNAVQMNTNRTKHGIIMDTAGVQQSLLRALQANLRTPSIVHSVVLLTFPASQTYIQIKKNSFSSRFSLDTGRIAVLHSCELIITQCKHLRGQQPQTYLELHGFSVPSGDISRWTIGNHPRSLTNPT